MIFDIGRGHGSRDAFCLPFEEPVLFEDNEDGILLLLLLFLLLRVVERKYFESFFKQIRIRGKFHDSLVKSVRANHTLKFLQEICQIRSEIYYRRE